MNNGERDPHHLHQTAYAYRFDWGLDGLGSLAPHSDVVIIVDVLRFTSAVSAALEGGSTVLPYPWDAERAEAYARSRHATAAGRREQGGLSLSPTDLLTMPSGTRLVLPSPNGAALSLAAFELGAPRVLVGCLRNATATARYAKTIAGRGVVSVIAAGEHWGGPTGPLRVAAEDLIGAGAILAALDPSGAVANPCCSPEAAAARAAFQQARPILFEVLSGTASGRDLIARGWEDDVATSAALDVTGVADELVGDEFVAA